MDNEAPAGERGVPDDGQIGARRARAYEELAGRLREEPGVTHVTLADRLLDVIKSILVGAVIFSAAGLYALMAVAVARRTREIGIRIALGANPRRVLRTVFARAARQLGGGIIAGNSLILLLAWRADSLTADLLVSSVITSVIMAAVGVLACAAPARRALRIQPTEALRQV
jgi:putative ABC transport system permease protein